ncbi:serine/threonine protein phosphatase [Paenibacillus sp. HJL G12]|uniref:Serine/threonine protein phosphatase n=1 Tax=Paenibacillus dendrobii TaxID=2691084 RepID=A0A7X3LHK6_9BACL|nr:metallophosphoesterase [Paenibacillus dendrobii]MWV44315.1 serine/threonine protein phosphatase [Paenibacillus dendrobii]
MKRIILISDIHGCIDEFNLMLKTVHYDSNLDQLILLGDYVDRGPRCKEVVERVIELVRNHHVIALKGNHDQRLVDLVRTPDEKIKSKFLEHGGLQTILSYNSEEDKGILEQDIHKFIAHMQENYEDHVEFLSTLPLYHEDEHHIYVHAGINPAYVHWKEQTEYDFMYIKDEFIYSPFDLGKKVVFGHTKTVDIHDQAHIWFDQDKIAIDGGCAYGLQLNALIFENGEYRTEYVSKMK